MPQMTSDASHAGICALRDGQIIENAADLDYRRSDISTVQ